MTGQDFHHGAPLNIPYTASTLRIGRDRLLRIADACGRPVGLENLAFAYSADEVRRHGEFLDRLLEPVNGFLILDLHNLYCQVENFGMDFETLSAMHPCTAFVRSTSLAAAGSLRQTAPTTSAGILTMTPSPRKCSITRNRSSPLSASALCSDGAARRGPANGSQQSRFPGRLQADGGDRRGMEQPGIR